MNILISGGTGGIGSAISKYFIKQGFEVYSIDLFDNDELKDHFHNFKVDVTNLKELHELKNELNGIKFQHILTLAGRAVEDEWVPFEKISDDSVLRSINLNLCGQINVVKVFFDCLTKNGKSSIVLMSSINAYGGFGLPFYSAAKMGLIGFCKTQRKEFLEQGVRINVIAPGTIVTPSTEKEPKDFGALLKTTKTGRFATKEEVAELAYNLCENSISSGTVSIIDEGQLEKAGEK